jgi:hypothetical protein
MKMRQEILTSKPWQYASLWAFGLAMMGTASAATLPAPGTVVCDTDNTQCVPVAIQYDDAYSYSTRVLDYLYPTDGWLGTAGTGTLDVIVTTRSSGQSNSGGALAPYDIPDPITNPNTDPILDTWGGGATTSTQMLVSDLDAYLFDTFGGHTPVFTFDQNETGGNPDLLASAKVEIIDPVTGVVHTWSFDFSTQAGDGVYDIGSPVTAPGTICIPDIRTAVDSDTVCFSNNVGSGKFDYILYVPTMDLSNPLWNDADNLFKVTWNFINVDDGGEEITLTGRLTPGSICETSPDLPQCQTIPEPDSLLLLGLGLIALVGVSTRTRLRSRP